MPDLSIIIPLAISVLIGFTVHEYVHAALADAAGDPTPRIYGRVTLNPLKHLDPFGTIFMLLLLFTGVGLGWGKPVPMDPRKMRNPRVDHFWAVFGAPLSNFILAVIGAIIVRVLAMTGIADPSIVLFFFLFVVVNLNLFVFNLIPIGPLDGMWVLGMAMPDRMRVSWTRFNLTFGSFVFLALVLIRDGNGDSAFSLILRPTTEFLRNILL